MAFGFTPHYTTDLYLDQLTPQQFLVLSLDTARELGWNLLYVSDAGFIAMTSGNMFKWKARVTLRITDDKASLRSESTGSELFDMGKNKKMVEKFTDSFSGVRYDFSAADLAQKYQQLKPQLPPPGKDTLSDPPATPRQKLTDIFSIFRPQPGYFITPIIVDLNLAIFLIMALSGVNVMEPTSQSLIDWGANVRFYTLDGGWWRLISCCFIHIGIPHLLFNMYALVFIGLLLEPRLGKARFAAAYLLTGIVASLTSLYWHDVTISVGASGAIFGMYGVFLAMLTTNLVEKKVRVPLMISIGIFVAYNLTYGMKGGIDNAAHIGGLLSGIAIGYLFYPGLRQPQNARYGYTTIGAAALFVLAVSIVVFRRTPDDIVQYEKKMETFARQEHRAIHAINGLSASTPKEQVLSAVKDSGLYYWENNIRLLDDMQRLHLPEPLKQRISILMHYCDLRVASYNYLYRKLQGTMGPGMDSTLYYNAQIYNVLASLKTQK